MVIRKGKVLRLKAIAARYEMSTRDIAEGCDVEMSRNWVSNIWNLTHKIKKQERSESIKRFLRKEGVPDELVEKAFDLIDEAEVEEARKSVKLKHRATPEQVEIESNPDLKIEKKGAVMLRRRVRAHFKLDRDPFQPRAEDKPFKSLAFLDCLDLVQDAIEMKAFLALSGPTGVGKSVLWTYLRQQLQGSRDVKVVAVRRFDKARILTHDIYLSILEDLADEGGSYKRGNERAHRRAEQLLVQYALANTNVVVLINEAHDLTPDGFVMLKRVWEMFAERPELGYMRSCAVIMLGQDSLATALNGEKPELLEVCQRADAEKYGLLRPDEVAPYLRHRMGAEDCDRIFDESALEFFATRRLRLTPQIINVMASRTINDAFQVGDERVTAEHASSLLR